MSAFPKIVRYLGTDDCGEGATCPHCGATGRYIVRFVVEDGRTLGAMRGCAKLFPVSPVATEELRLMDKAARYRAKGWHLNRDDMRAWDAINSFYRSEITEAAALAICKSVKAQAMGRWASARRGR